MTERYTTILGEQIEYPTPTSETASFLERVKRAAHDPAVTEAQLTELVFGRENPILDQTIFPGRGAVTKAVHASPIWHVMQDLVDAKRVQTRALDPAAAAASFSMTVGEAATQLGVSESAVRQAITAKHLAAIKRGSVYLIDPHTVATYRDRVSRRGPAPAAAAAPELEVRVGNEPGASFMVKGGVLEDARRISARVQEGVVRSWQHAAVKFGGKTGQRMLVLEPSDEPNEFVFGQFFVRGRYRVTEKINNARQASERWREFPE